MRIPFVPVAIGGCFVLQPEFPRFAAVYYFEDFTFFVGLLLIVFCYGYG